MQPNSSTFSVCKYHNNHQTAATLMIDDLAPVAITLDGKLSPNNDHGYGMKAKNSLYSYFEKHFLEEFPEARGTFFILINQHTNHTDGNGGHKILSSGFSDDYVGFIKSTNTHFDLAYHGTNHGKIENGRFHQEFSYLDKSDISRLSKALETFKDQTGISFDGGKYPGYISNEHSKEIIEKLGMKWWAHSRSMKNKRTPENEFSYFGNEDHVLNFPTNFSGEVFKTFLKPKEQSFASFRAAYLLFRKFNRERHLQYLYENGLVISIQEHFTTWRADGKYQRPNVFDDLMSLKQIYSTLRGADIWHAGCNEIARYIENRDYCKVKQSGQQLSVSYNGRYPDFSISLKSKNRNSLKNEQGNIIHPVSKGGFWIYSNVKAGNYTIG